MSERVCGEVFRLLGKSADAALDSALVPLAGGGAREQEAARASVTPLRDAPLDERLWKTYGLAAQTIVERIHGNPELGAPVAGLAELTHAEVEHAVRSEMAVNLDDLLRRRCRVAMFDTAAAIEAAPGVARALGRVLGWSDERIGEEAGRVIAQWNAELALVRAA